MTRERLRQLKLDEALAKQAEEAKHKPEAKQQPRLQGVPTTAESKIETAEAKVGREQKGEEVLPDDSEFH